jgi:nitrous oxidase accessory protein
VAAAFLVGCLTLQASGATPEPEAPQGCRHLTHDDDVQAALDAAPPGTTLCLAPGVYAGPLRIEGNRTLWGPRDAIVRSPGTGSTVSMGGKEPQLVGVTVDGSGSRFDLVEAGIHVLHADGARIEGVHVVRATFGVVVEQSERVVVRDNDLVGTGETAIGLRGDAIRLWETQHSLVAGNHVTASRDVVVWYSPHNRIERNRVEDARYGTHLMYSHDNAVVGNQYIRDEVGVFVMYSRDIEVRDNVIADAAGAAGMGLGIKESGNLTVVGNRFIHDTIGSYLDTTPLQRADSNVFERNVYRLGDTGIVFHSSERQNRFVSNSFRDNQVQVRVDGGGDALGVEWDGNDFDDYGGYDLNGDGIGDVPYELRSLSVELTDRYPSLLFLHGSPTLAFVEVAGRALPLFQPSVVLRDPHPRMAPSPWGEHAH